MPSYGREYEPRRMGIRNFAEERGYGSEYRQAGRERTWRGGRMPSPAGLPIGGVRSDAQPPRWDRFAGEEGWFGQGHPGYPDVDARQERFRGGSRNRGRRGRGPEGPGSFGPRPGGVIAGESNRVGRRGSGYDSGPWGGSGQERWSSDAIRVRVRDIMTEHPDFVTPTTSVTEVARRMRELDVGIIPVVDDESNRRLRGVVTDRDLAIRVLAAGKDGGAQVLDHMTEHVRTVNEHAPIREVFDVMKREQVRRVPVVDDEGRLVGIVAQADLAVGYAGLDLHRETEVEEVIERISEPARPRNR